jgi:pyrroline-5-carboxylate reductase
MDEIAFLGAGSMTAAMVDGMIAKGACAAGKIICIGGSGASGPALSKRTASGSRAPLRNSSGVPTRLSSPSSRSTLRALIPGLPN